MENIEANKLIEKIQKDINKSGIDAKKTVESLTQLRTYALEEQDPTATKVLRMAYEHIQEYGTFNIPIPADELVADNDDDEPELIENSIETDEERTESLAYMLSLLLDRHNPNNRQELFEYRDALKNY
ncbi:MAG: hypothetical protein OQJ96_01175 [Flavobacteriales bacterium]|nr:hypothetical protein [Flavobacteriales bacterium]MCW8911910.1 hypothetical protein [Flavobacteriales bacterium]MCW8937370.1 hypothetical protein [Flavobacteriales bacterium]MCW8968957.1 hypothetical protein [Flavobacteriales bacterium]MCW8990052.1 hypothetical protein [Flavobacteriales bacterium]